MRDWNEKAGFLQLVANFYQTRRALLYTIVAFGSVET